MKAIVLSGGGSKGSYQIGAWKALRKLKIDYDIVTGTSVGALNGAFFVQKKYHKAIHVWKHLNLKLLFGDEATSDTSGKEIFKMYKNNFLKHGGMEVKNLEKLIEENIDLQSFYNSNINYGLITVNMSTKKPFVLQKKDIPHDKLVDYLMASASCYPAFQAKDIDGEKYIDGGIYDNLPINLAIDMGATEIITVDLNAPGFTRIPKKKLPITRIKPNNSLSFFLNFNEAAAKRNILFGYNDTMKVFNKLDGKHFTFKKNQIEKCFKRYNETYIHYLKLIFGNKSLNKFLNIPAIKKVLMNTDNKKNMLDLMEKLGKMFDLEETTIYSYRKFNRHLRREVKKYCKTENPGKVEKLFKTKATTIDFYQKLYNKKYRDIKTNALLNPHDFLCALYLYTLEEE